MGVYGYVLYPTTYARSQCSNFKLGVPKVPFMGWGYSNKNLTQSTRDRTLPQLVIGHSPGPGVWSRGHLQALPYQGVLRPWASAGHHSCFPMVNPMMAVSSLVSLPAWSLTCWAGNSHLASADLLFRGRGESPPLPSSPLAPPAGQSGAIAIQLHSLHMFIRTSLHCVCDHEKLCCHHWTASKERQALPKTDLVLWVASSQAADPNRQTLLRGDRGQQNPAARKRPFYTQGRDCFVL